MASKQTIQAGLEAAVNRSRRGLVRSAIFSRSSKDAFRQLLLILFSFGGNIVSNSGLQYKHPRGVCTTPVKSNQNGIQCDMCDVWFHAKCDVKCHAIDLFMFIHMCMDMFKLRVPQLLWLVLMIRSILSLSPLQETLTDAETPLQNFH